MAANLGAISDRLFRDFMAPLVVGGAIVPGRPVGGKNALLLDEHQALTDPDLVSHVEVARVRAARALWPLDRVEGPTGPEWALVAALHDLVQTTHPDLSGLFRGSASERLLRVVDLTLDRIPPPASVGDALSRHTWMARMLEIARTDTSVHFWVGSRQFLGEEPPARLLAWPELRRVRVDKTPHALLDLPAAGGHVDPARFASAVAHVLSRTPLTDVATCTRLEPAFAWTPENLALVATRGGRTLALRALARQHELDVDAALGRATAMLVSVKAVPALTIAAAVLGERALGAAEDRAQRGVHAPETTADDALWARGVGAYVATQMIAARPEAFAPSLREAILAQLRPELGGTPARTVGAMLSPAATSSSAAGS